MQKRLLILSLLISWQFVGCDSNQYDRSNSIEFDVLSVTSLYADASNLAQQWSDEAVLVSVSQGITTQYSSLLETTDVLFRFETQDLSIESIFGVICDQSGCAGKAYNGGAMQLELGRTPITLQTIAIDSQEAVEIAFATIDTGYVSSEFSITLILESDVEGELLWNVVIHNAAQGSVVVRIDPTTGKVFEVDEF